MCFWLMWLIFVKEILSLKRFYKIYYFIVMLFYFIYEKKGKRCIWNK